MALVIEKRESYVTGTRGLRRDIPPMKLWEKAKKLGIWNPLDIDFSQDTEDWKGLNDRQKEYVMTLVSQFISGEEAVTLDLLPLMKTVADQGHLEEEMFLTTFLWEEAKHMDFFSRAIESWGVEQKDLQRYYPPSYMGYFGETFSQRMNVLYEDPSPVNLIRASATYNMAIEGILAETGYYSWYMLMDSNNILPGAREGIRNLQLDESRHIAYGVWLCSRLIAEDPSLFDHVKEIMDEGLAYLQQSTVEQMEKSGDIPFDYDYGQVIEFGMSQYSKRLARLEKARGKTLDELYKTGDEFILEDAAF